MKRTKIYVSFDEPAVRQLERQAWEEGITIPAAVERDTVNYIRSKAMETKPINFKEANSLLTLPAVGKDCGNLPCFKDGEHVVSCWKIPFWRRWRVLFTGRVWLCVRGQTHPPLWIETSIFIK